MKKHILLNGKRGICQIGSKKVLDRTMIKSLSLKRKITIMKLNDDELLGNISLAFGFLLMLAGTFLTGVVFWIGLGMVIGPGLCNIIKQEFRIKKIYDSNLIVALLSLAFIFMDLADPLIFGLGLGLGIKSFIYTIYNIFTRSE